MNHATRDQHSGFRAWLDRRTGLDSLLRHALDEPIPGGAKIAYVFGSGLLFLFLSQVVTGVFLAMYYVPSADHAHTTVEYITKEVTGGSFLRSIHAYGSSAIIIVLLLHLTQTFLYGSYKGRRELVWVAGCALLLLMLGMAFTGYLGGLDDKQEMAKKATQEEQMRGAFKKQNASASDPWDEIANAMKVQRDMFLPLTYVERLRGFNSDLARIARGALPP